MLDMAKSWLQQIMETLRPQIQAGIPLVGMEPSCVAVFRDELTNLFPQEHDAQRLHKQFYMLSEFLKEEAKDFALPALRRKALVQGHCHHKSIMGTHDETVVLNELGLDVSVPWEGCGGMAGSFGFESDHYAISQQIGELGLLPAVRQAPKDTLIIADGFSCREQIGQGTKRRALHLAQVIQMAMHEGPDGPSGSYPEAGYPYDRKAMPRAVPALAAAGLLAAGGYWLWKQNRRNGSDALEASPGRRRQDIRTHLRHGG
jgi:Fe-S oxidoreductase